MKKLVLVLAVCALWSLNPAQAQNAVTPDGMVPNMLRFAGNLSDASGRPLSGTLGVTFFLYKEQAGGTPLWIETQNVQVDRNGHYSILLGSTTGHGIPANAFAAGEARWLGVQPSGQDEQPRVQLVSVPYALKAADAQTLGGLPPSAFLLAPLPASAPTTEKGGAASGPAPVGTIPVTTSGGTAQTLAKFDANADIANSQIFDNGTNVGIGVTSPKAKLDVNGGGVFRGLLTMPATGTANATAGKNSQPLNFTASTFANLGTAVNQTFRWQAEPVGNNTATPAAKLNLLFASGSNTPAETGLSVSNSGLLTFASGQTFPGTGKGSVTSVGLSAPSSDFSVSGSPVTGSGTLNLQWLVQPTSASSANAIVKRDANGGFSAGSVSVNGDLTMTGLLTVPEAFVTDRLSANTAISSTHLIASMPDTTFNAVAVEGDATAFSTSGITFGVNGSSNSTSGVGVHGIGNLTGVWGENFAGGTDADGVLGVATGFGNGVEGLIESSAGSGVAALNLGTGDALFAQSVGGFAAFFLGDVDVDGRLSKAAGSFKIDHPLDPANKYLYHSFVESPDMMNVYNGNITTDAQGVAVVQMPDWFEALNRDFRYQLTVIGQFAQAIVASEMASHHFTIRTDKPNVKVSWQVTGIRQDVYANAHRIPVEELKPEQERGLYLHPELFGAAAEKSIAALRHPGPMKTVRDRKIRTTLSKQ